LLCTSCFVLGTSSFVLEGFIVDRLASIPVNQQNTKNKAPSSKH